MNLGCIYFLWKEKSGSFLYLNSLLKCPIQFLFHFLLQEACSFCLLHSSGGGLEATVVARRVAFVYLGAVLLVYANNNHTCRQGQHSSEPWPWHFSVSHLHTFWNAETRLSHREDTLRVHQFTYSSPVVASQRSACRLVRCQQFSYRACPLESHNHTCTASWQPHSELAGLGICCQL